MEDSLPELGDLEREVMQLVWANGPVTAEAVREKLSRPLKESTVRTVLRRLEDKGYTTHTVDGRTYQMPNRSHHELLLLLVEARLSAQKQGLPDDESGWMTLDEATRSAAVGINKLNLDIFRLRREFEGLGLRDPRQLIERRDARREIRVGTGKLTIHYERPRS